MDRWVFGFAFGLAWVTAVFGADIDTSVLDVAVNGRCERAGLVQLRLTGDDFAGAAPDAPIYLRVAFDHGARLRESLVDPLRGDAPIEVPVNLVRSGDFEGSLNLAPDAIEVVRWRAGEPQLWLAIRQATSTWLTTPSGFSAPTPDLAVILAVGRSHQDIAAAAAGVDTRHWPQQKGRAVALDLKLDLSTSSLVAAPAPPELSLLNADVQWFDATTRGVESAAEVADIQLGEPLAVLFAVDHPVARAVEAPAADLVVWGAVPKWDCDQGRRPLTALSVAVQSNLFAGASGQAPLYLRLQLPAGTSLAHTRVAAGEGNMPVLLPLWTPRDAADTPVMNAAADALQIVRYQAGEDAIWLRINQSSDQWLRDETNTFGPSPSQPVYFQLGGAVAQARAFLQPLYAASRANLPAPCRAHDAGDADAAVSTRLVVDLAPVPEAHDALFGWTLFDASTGDVALAESADGIQFGQSQRVTLSGDTRAAFLTPAAGAVGPQLVGEVAAVAVQEVEADLGRLGLRFEGDWFDGGTTRWTIRLPQGAVLSETWVAPGAPPLVVTPALAADADCDLQVVAGPMAASITRWVAGEDHIVLTLAEPTAEWLLEDGRLRAPDRADPVTLWLGESEAAARARRDARWVYCRRTTAAKRALAVPFRVTLDDALLGLDTYLAVELLDADGISRARIDLGYRDE